MTISIGDLVWFTPNKHKALRPQKELGIGMVIKIWKGEGTASLYRVRWQKPENFRYANCYEYQLVNVITTEEKQLPKQQGKRRK